MIKWPSQSNTHATEAVESASQPTAQEENNYQQMLQSWKVNQRNSISKQEAQRLTTYFNSKDDTPDNNVSVVEDPTTIIQKYCDEIIRYLKAKFVVEELIEQLEKLKLVKMSDHVEVEFMHLICFRAWCDINFALNTFAEQKNLFKSQTSQILGSNPEHDALTILVVPMFKLGQKIEKMFQLYHKTLSFKEKSFNFKFKSFIDFIFHNQEKKNRDRIVYGVEGKDFSREEQIIYTKDHLIPQMRKNLLEKQGKGAMKIRTLLLAYHRIMKIEFMKLESFDDFQVLKNTLIQEEEAKKKSKLFQT